MVPPLDVLEGIRDIISASQGEGMAMVISGRGIGGGWNMEYEGIYSQEAG